MCGSQSGCHCPHGMGNPKLDQYYEMQVWDPRSLGAWKRGHRAIERGCQKRRWQWFTCQKEASFHIAHPGGLVEMDLHSRGVPASAHWVIMVFSGWSLVLCMRGNLEGVVAISSDRQTWMYIYWALSAGISKHWTLMQHSDYGATI